MKKILKVFGTIGVTLYFSLCMFYCFISGAPEQRDSLLIYVIVTAGFSLLMPGFLCLCVHYILYLQKKLSQEKENQNS